jgi:hypothetical protein
MCTQQCFRYNSTALGGLVCCCVSDFCGFSVVVVPANTFHGEFC